MTGDRRDGLMVSRHTEARQHCLARPHPVRRERTACFSPGSCVFKINYESCIGERQAE